MIAASKRSIGKTFCPNVTGEMAIAWCFKGMGFPCRWNRRGPVIALGLQPAWDSVA
jgi:hypothetical protein